LDDVDVDELLELASFLFGAGVLDGALSILECRSDTTTTTTTTTEPSRGGDDGNDDEDRGAITKIVSPSSPHRVAYLVKGSEYFKQFRKNSSNKKRKMTTTISTGNDDGAAMTAAASGGVGGVRRLRAGTEYLCLVPERHQQRQQTVPSSSRHRHQLHFCSCRSFLERGGAHRDQPPQSSSLAAENNNSNNITYCKHVLAVKLASSLSGSRWRCAVGVVETATDDQFAAEIADRAVAM